MWGTPGTPQITSVSRRDATQQQVWPSTAGTLATAEQQKTTSSVGTPETLPAREGCQQRGRRKQDCKSKCANVSRDASNGMDVSNSRQASNCRDTIAGIPCREQASARISATAGSRAHFSCNKCPIYTLDGARAKFSTNSHKTDNIVEGPTTATMPATAGMAPTVPGTAGIQEQFGCQ